MNGEKRKLIPEQHQYSETLKLLSEKKESKCLIAIRMGCEMGLTRLEIVNARISDIDRFHKRGLWIETAKQVRRGFKKDPKGKNKPKFEMRKRELPVNANLYQLLMSYIDEGQKYILERKFGDFNKPFIPRYINYLYEKNNVPWSTHKSRHYFKNRIADWMRENKQIDIGLIKELMGHKKTVTEDYGSYSWDYKRDIIDRVIW